MDLPQAVQAAQRPEVRDAIHRLYADLDRQIALRKPRCDASGRCCNFEAFGHRLYITTAELATFLSDLAEYEGAQPRRGGHNPHSLPLLTLQPACRFQISGLCSVHTLRPFGCRIFFCDPTADTWMTDTYEHFHTQLKYLHTTHGLEYHYVEWRQALGELGL